MQYPIFIIIDIKKTKILLNRDLIQNDTNE
jgi:hypothetical protein